MFLAKLPEGRQPFLCLGTVLIAQTFAQIKLAKVRTEFAFGGDERIELAQIVVAAGAEAVRDRFGRGDFRPNKPKGVNERQRGSLLPFVTQVPELKGAFGFIAKTNRLVTN